MDNLITAGRIVLTVNGIEFTLRRRSTFVMAQARGFGAVVGQLAPGETDEATEIREYETFQESVLRVALLSPIVVPKGEPAVPPHSYEYADIAPFAQALMKAFMDSGIEPDPS